MGNGLPLKLPPEVTQVTPIHIMLVEANHVASLTFKGQGKCNHTTFPQEKPDYLRTAPTMTTVSQLVSRYKELTGFRKTQFMTNLV